MKTLTYNAVVCIGDDGCYGIDYPDFNADEYPGFVISSADTEDEIEEKATEALQLHVDGMQEDGFLLPEPTDIVDEDITLSDFYKVISVVVNVLE